MATTIDNLQIDLEVSTDGLKGLDNLSNSLKSFQSSIKGVTGKRIEEFANGLQKLVNAVGGLKGLDKLDSLGEHLRAVAEPLKDINDAGFKVMVPKREGEELKVKATDEADKSINATDKEKAKTVKATNKATKANGDFLKSIVRIAKYRLIRAALKAIADGVKSATNNLYTWDKFMGGNGAFSSSLDQLASSLVYLQNAFGVAFAPLVEVVTPILVSVMDKIAEFSNKLSELFAKMQGKNVYTAATKSAVTYMQVAKQAQNVTLGFDELNTTGNQMNIGSMFQQVATSEDAFSDISDILVDIKDNFTSIANSVKPIISGVVGLVNTLLPILLNLIEKITGLLAPIFDAVNRIVGVVGIILDAVSPILDVVVKLAGVIIDAISPVIESVANLISRIVEVLMPILEPTINFVAHMLDSLTPVINLIVSIVDEIIIQIADVLELLKPLATLMGAIFEHLEPIISFINDLAFATIAAVLEGIVGILKTMNVVVEGLTKAFKALISGDMKGFVAAFSEMGAKIKAIWGDVGKNIANVFINAINGIISGFEKAINFIVKGINKVVEAVSKVSEFFGGREIAGIREVSFSRIPAYAIGGFPEDGLFMANHNELVGQFSNGQTAVANNEQIVEGISTGVYDAVVSAMGNNNNGGEIKLNVYLDGRQLKASYDRLTRQQGYVIDAGGML